jgi:hypothetical protein
MRAGDCHGAPVREGGTRMSRSRPAVSADAEVRAVPAGGRLLSVLEDPDRLNDGGL